MMKKYLCLFIFFIGFFFFFKDVQASKKITVKFNYSCDKCSGLKINGKSYEIKRTDGDVNAPIEIEMDSEVNFIMPKCIDTGDTGTLNDPIYGYQVYLKSSYSSDSTGIKYISSDLRQSGDYDSAAYGRLLLSPGDSFTIDEDMLKDDEMIKKYSVFGEYDTITFVGKSIRSMDEVSTWNLVYKGCSSLSENSVQKYNSNTRKALSVEHCSDDDFLGWYAHYSNDKSFSSAITLDYCPDDKLHSSENGVYCDNIGRKLLKDGDTFYEPFDNGITVTLTKVTKDSGDKFNIEYKNCTNFSGQQSVSNIISGYPVSINECSDSYFDGWLVSDDVYVCKGNNCNKLTAGSMLSSNYCNESGVFLYYTVGKTLTLTASKRIDTCSDVTNSNSCKVDGCAWNDEHSFCSPNGLSYLKCGDSYDIPEIVPKLTSYAVTLLKTVAPIILIVVSIIQLIKGIVASKEDEIKKAQGSLIKKVIIAALIFFVVTIVQFIMLRVTSDDTEKGNLSSCLSCFLNGVDRCESIYYKDGYGSCYYVESGSKFDCE